MVHGDDFVTVGSSEQAQWLKERMEERFEIKTKVVGNGEGESQEESVLNRMVRVTDEGWQYEADQRHADIILQAMRMSNCKPRGTVGEDGKEWQEAEDEGLLPKEQETEYRALAARANYLAADLKWIYNTP